MTKEQLVMVALALCKYEGMDGIEILRILSEVRKIGSKCHNWNIAQAVKRLRPLLLDEDYLQELRLDQIAMEHDEPFASSSYVTSDGVLIRVSIPIDIAHQMMGVTLRYARRIRQDLAQLGEDLGSPGPKAHALNNISVETNSGGRIDIVTPHHYPLVMVGRALSSANARAVTLEKRILKAMADDEAVAARIESVLKEGSQE